VGTCVEAVFKHSHIDRAPLGNMVDTIVTLLISDPKIDFIYRHYKNGQKYTLNTIEIKNVLREVPINNMEVIEWIKNNIKQGLEDLES
jgi:hypothetical protein